uniref:uncharacterized protein LOC114673812 n=1 Tax=Macaca mulatta TaxID=9544 RepID=UPI0010A27C7C|nr:uncharacterized protein LOC114673812 [Macaca mulatta]
MVLGSSARCCRARTSPPVHSGAPCTHAGPWSWDHQQAAAEHAPLPQSTGGRPALTQGHGLGLISKVPQSPHLSPSPQGGALHSRGAMVLGSSARCCRHFSPSPQRGALHSRRAMVLGSSARCCRARTSPPVHRGAPCTHAGPWSWDHQQAAAEHAPLPQSTGGRPALTQGHGLGLISKVPQSTHLSPSPQGGALHSRGAMVLGSSARCCRHFSPSPQRGALHSRRAMVLGSKPGPAQKGQEKLHLTRRKRGEKLGMTAGGSGVSFSFSVFETGSCHTAQAGLKLLGVSDPPTSASQVPASFSLGSGGESAVKLIVVTVVQLCEHTKTKALYTLNEWIV